MQWAVVSLLRKDWMDTCKWREHCTAVPPSVGAGGGKRYVDGAYVELTGGRLCLAMHVYAVLGVQHARGRRAMRTGRGVRSPASRLPGQRAYRYQCAEEMRMTHCGANEIFVSSYDHRRRP